MNPFIQQIETTPYMLVAEHLRSRVTPIEYILHLRSAEFLPVLAARLHEAMECGRATPADIPELLRPALEDDLVRITSQRPFVSAFIAPKHLLSGEEIPPRTLTRTLYLPPFYLCHTPGLFEGEVLRAEPKKMVPAVVKRRCKF